MRQLHPGAQRHVPEMRYVREHDGVFVKAQLRGSQVRAAIGRPFC
jgi:hypothetical protein